MNSKYIIGAVVPAIMIAVFLWIKSYPLAGLTFSLVVFLGLTDIIEP